jgi:hypothetical protein
VILFSPLSYFRICWNKTPSDLPRSAWLTLIIKRRAGKRKYGGRVLAISGSGELLKTQIEARPMTDIPRGKYIGAAGRSPGRRAEHFLKCEA